MTVFAHSDEGARSFLLSTLGLQLIGFYSAWIIVPGYIVPFLNHPIARMVLLGLIGWEVIGIGVLIFTAFRAWKAIIFLILCVVPFGFALLIGPVIVTCSGCGLGPIMGGQREDMLTSPPNIVPSYPETACKRNLMIRPSAVRY